ncbi:MAG: hypothetical protein WBO55_05290 [Rhizobiaceae bacterium]
MRMAQITAILSLTSLAALATLAPAIAETCEEKFARLEVDGNSSNTPVRLTITTQTPGGQITKNYHYSDEDHNGMTEMIDPVDMAWSLFIGNDMYVSNDKGKSWTHMNTWDKEKSTADRKAQTRADMATASGITCGEEELDGTKFDTVEGAYKSTMLQGANRWVKFWVSQSDGEIVRTDDVTDSAAGQYKSTQLIEPWPDFELPKP